jgi:2-oxoglutarate ferredoxin oxidoreductase subunit delta
MGIAETLGLRRRSPMLLAPSPVRGDVHIQIQRCKGCGLCTDCCPNHVLRLSESFNDAGYHYPVVAGEDCVCCQACYMICPDLAIFAVLREAASRESAGAGTAVTPAQRDLTGEVRQ